ncbi:MAG: class I SAM-dependent methyltransferase [Desulfomonilaceae bacterium]
MTVPSAYNFTRYLAAKKSVDDRALNRTVWKRLAQAVASYPVEDRLRVLEIGAGIGTMVERALDWGLLTRATYLALDSEQANISEASSRLPLWASGKGYSVENGGANNFSLRGKDQDILINLETADVFDFLDRESGNSKWDLLIANAFLDLIDVPSTLPDLLSLLKPGGLFYFTITFDGATIVQPEIDPAFDAQIEALYHETMDRRVIGGKPSGDSRTGRHFFDQVRSAGATLLEAGASDWVVFAGPNGYRGDEAYFLHFIVHTIGSALERQPALDQERLAWWVRERHTQVDQGRLVYIAHQIDFLGRVSE